MLRYGTIMWSVRYSGLSAFRFVDLSLLTSLSYVITVNITYKLGISSVNTIDVGIYGIYFTYLI